MQYNQRVARLARLSPTFTGGLGLGATGSTPVTYTVAGTYTPNLPAGNYLVTVQGAGASGQVSGNRGSFGGCSGEVITFVLAWTGGTVTVVVGAGGAPVSSVGSGGTGAIAGNSGQASSFTAGTVVALANGANGPAVTPGSGGTLPTGANVSSVTDTNGNGSQKSKGADSVLAAGSGGLAGTGLYAPGLVGGAPGAGGGPSGNTDGTTLTTSGGGRDGSVTVIKQ